MFHSIPRSAILGFLCLAYIVAGSVGCGNPEVGAFMTRFVFEPGRTMTWNELTRFATDADLSPEAFARDFREE